jgi:hypothetical protein
VLSKTVQSDELLCLQDSDPVLAISEFCCQACSQLLSQSGIAEILASNASNTTQPIVGCTLPSSLPIPVMDTIIDYFSSELRVVIQKLCSEAQQHAGMRMPPTAPEMASKTSFFLAILNRFRLF